MSTPADTERAAADIAERVSRCLQTCQTRMGLDVADPQLDRAVDGLRRDDPDAAAELVAAALHTLLDPTGPPAGSDAQQVLDQVAELHALQQDIAAVSNGRREERMAAIRSALRRLREAPTTAEMTEQVVWEACAACGFDRCALMRADGSHLVVERAHFDGERAWAERWLHYSQTNPSRLDTRDLEVELLRRQVPILAAHPQESAHGLASLVRTAESTSYVAAPVVASGSVIGTLHADHLFSGRHVDTIDRDSLAVFAEGFGLALERLTLLESVRAERHKLRELVAALDADPEPGLDALPSPGQAPLRASPHAAARLSTLLTSREQEVLSLMASGATNTMIAERLVISQGTVKSHVKAVFRKLHAANRAEAVARYYRICGTASADDA